MCSSRYYDVLSVALSLLAGVIFAVLSFLNLLVTDLTIPILALVIALFALGAAAHGNAHGLRCGTFAPRLIGGALFLAAVGVFALVFAPLIQVVNLILTFLIFSLVTYTLFNLFCYLTCLEKRGTDPGCR